MQILPYYLSKCQYSQKVHYLKQQWCEIFSVRTHKIKSTVIMQKKSRILGE